MQFQEKFKFLNYQVINRKNAAELPEGEKSFVKLNLLDKENNPCAFMVFNNETIKKLQSAQLGSLAEISVIFEVVYNNNNWSVRMVSFVTK